MKESCIAAGVVVMVIVLMGAVAHMGPSGPVLSAQVKEAQGPSPVVTEELVAEKDPGAAVDDEEDVVSLDGRKAAWRTAKGNKWAVMLNGERQAGEYDQVQSLFFSRDGQHLAFAARSGKTWLMVLDAREPAQRFDEIGSPVFSRDGSRIAYAARRDKKWLVVLDGNVPATSYDKVGSPVFSPDGRHLAFPAKRSGKWFMNVDGNEAGIQLDDLVARIFSPDGQHLAYAGRRGEKWVVVLDDKESQPFDIVGGMSFSTDSRRFACAVADVRKGFSSQKAQGHTVIDGVAGPQFEGNPVGSALKKMSGQQPELVEGYHIGLSSETHGVTAPIFSGDGRRVAYVAHRGKNDEVVMVDGQPGPQFGSIVAGPVFSADSQHVAYVVSEEGAKTLVVDGQRVGNRSLPGADFVFEVVFAPDNRRAAFIAITGSRWAGYLTSLATGVQTNKAVGRRAKRRVYVDGVPGREYDTADVLGPRFTADSHQVIYVVDRLAENSQTVSFVVVGSAEGKRYDFVFASTLALLDTRTMVYVAQAGKKFLRVTQSIQ